MNFSGGVQRLTLSLVIFASTWFWLGENQFGSKIWPSIVAIVIVLVTKSAFIGLLVGALSGAVLLEEGHLIRAVFELFGDHLLSSLHSRWNLHILAFSLLMGGFVGVIEFGGGISGILVRLLGKNHIDNKKAQYSVFGLGGICFFDGLANSMLVGRIMRPFADQAKISREKLAYLVDSTSSPIACIALISTWIAYQLSMIQEGLSIANYDANPYFIFLQSIPHNYYCLYTLILVFLVISFRFDLGPMVKAEKEAQSGKSTKKGEILNGRFGNGWQTIIPLLFLIIAVFSGLYLSGAQGIYELKIEAVASAFGRADSALVLVVSSSISCLVALACNCGKGKDLKPVFKAFFLGMRSLVFPLLILLCAWCLSSTLKRLETAKFAAQILSGNSDGSYLPVLVYLVGGVISFCTGTSWGTIGVLMPLAIPIAVEVSGSAGTEEISFVVISTIAAVFSGAVFGDHCSPFSDTTIVSSLACEVDPLKHVQTQIPYASLAAGFALLGGFLPLALGMNYWLYISLGILAMLGGTSRFWQKKN